MRCRHPSTITKRAPVISVSRSERTAFRFLLNDVIKEVRAGFRNIQISKAWVHTKDGKHWEFRGPDKYLTVVLAKCAFEARAKGWKEWMKEQDPNDPARRR